MSKMCIKCLHYYDDDLQVCPYCNKEDKYNVKNPFMELSNSSNSYLNHENIKEIEEIKKINNKEEDKSIKEDNSIFFNNKKDEAKENNEKKVIEKEKKKTKSTKINIYSYIALILSFILLFIVVLSCTVAFDVILFIHYSITAILLIFAYRLSLDGKTGYYLGVVASFSMILMIIEKDYVDFVVGIYMFFSSFSYLIKK